MECFVIFVMAWCWFNATESKPQNVSCDAMTTVQQNDKDKKYIYRWTNNNDHNSIDNGNF